jgi:thioredoxin 1
MMGEGPTMNRGSEVRLRTRAGRLARRAAVVGLIAALVLFGLAAAAQTGSAAAPEPEKVAFLELGSEGCLPCEAMKPVMQAVRDKYGDRVEVVFYDVRKNRAVGREYRIRLIPTQIFLRADGTEFFRHEGYLPLEEVEKVLRGMGVEAAKDEG